MRASTRSERVSDSPNGQSSRDRVVVRAAETLGPAASTADLAGVEAAIWAETIDDFAGLTFLLLPRPAGSADRAWSDPAAGSWSDHRAAPGAHGRLWEQDDLTDSKSSIVDWAPAAGRDVGARS
jgi:Glycosyl hydrolase family 20, catalytic domain